MRKKWLAPLVICLLLVGGGIWLSRPKTVDFSGTVSQVHIEGETVYVTALHSTYDSLCKIAIPTDAVCRDTGNTPLSAKDIQSGDRLLCNFEKADSESEVRTPKGKITLIPGDREN